jgi:hypothetical protein
MHGLFCTDAILSFRLTKDLASRVAFDTTTDASSIAST